MTIDEKAKIIKFVIFDIDGVLTDGRIVHGNYGDELKFFDVQDGLGIVLLHRAQIKVAIITAKASRIVKNRAKELKIKYVFQNHHDKLKIFEKLLKKFKLSPDEVCFIGDDLIDIPILKRVGLSISVPNAVPEVKEITHYTTERSGGHGAAREIIDIILKAQGKWEEVTAKYFK